MKMKLTFFFSKLCLISTYLVVSCEALRVPPLPGGNVTEASCEDLASDWCRTRVAMCREEKMKVYCSKLCGYCADPPPVATLPPGITNPPYKGKCGVPEVKSVRIIAGSTPPRGAWPWQVLLTDRDFPTCGGTLISPEWVITAAHCVFRRESHPEYFVVRVGEHNRRLHEGSEIDVKVAKIIRHPKYSTAILNHDIALLKLSRPVKLNKYVQPACLPSQDAPVGTKCYMTGWGKTHHPGYMTMILQQGMFPIVSTEVCYLLNRDQVPVPIMPDEVCGGSGGRMRTQACHGDSGGPYVCHVGGVWELHGSVSWASPRCRSYEAYTVFARTNYFKGWIREMMATH